MVKYDSREVCFGFAGDRSITSWASLKIVVAINCLVCLCIFTVSEICSQNFLPKRFLLFFWKRSDFVFRKIFASVEPFIVPSRTFNLLWKRRVEWVKPIRSTVYCTKLSRSSMSNIDTLYLLVPKQGITFPEVPWYPIFSSRSFHKPSVGSMKPSNFSL